MRAVTWQGRHKISVETVPDPEIVNPRDAIIRVTSTAICGSDLHLYDGYIPGMRAGDIVGHEFMGEVVETGAASTLKRGQRVVVPFTISCGQCFFCEKQQYSACDNSNPSETRDASELMMGHAMGGAFGYAHLTGGYAGGQAEYVRIPYSDVGPVVIPDDLADDDVLFLSDILPTGYQAAEMGEIKPGETVAIFGAGPVGLFAAKSAWLMGAGRVIVVDRQDYRLEFAKQWAQCEVLDYEDEGRSDVVGKLKKMTDGLGPDVCIDAVGCEASGSFMQKALGMGKLQAGAATALMWSVQAVRRAGNVVAIGVYGPPWNLVPLGELMNKGLTLRGAQCNVKRYMPRLLEHIRAGRIDPKGIITHRGPLDAAPDFYETFARKQDHCIKCVLVPNAA